jgi:fructose-bisphosphate aldolase class II
MHGGSGVSVENYKKVIARGIRKINYYTYMSKAAGNAVAALADKTYFHDIELAAIAAVKEDVTAAMKVFGNLD